MYMLDRRPGPSCQNAYLRRTGEQLCKKDGRPGCIFRMWSARAGKGKVKIYLDGAAEPAVDLAFDDYFSRKTAANGFHNFVPVAYQKSCKIVGDKDMGNYYQFTYFTFPKETGRQRSIARWDRRRLRRCRRPTRSGREQI